MGEGVDQDSMIGGWLGGGSVAAGEDCGENSAMSRLSDCECNSNMRSIAPIYSSVE